MSKKTLKKFSGPKPKSEGIPMSWVIGILLVLVVAIAIFAFSQKPTTITPGDTNLSAGGQSKGKADSKVTIVEFSDFQCPACGAAYPTVKRIQDEYSDRVLFVYQHFPLTQIHPLAVSAAEAAECAGAQGKFWEAHDALFENQSLWATQGAPSYGRGGINEILKPLNLDEAKFNDCWVNRQKLAVVQAGLDLGNRVGINATPTFFINGQKLQGAASYDTFKSEIERRLNS